MISRRMLQIVFVLTMVAAGPVNAQPRPPASPPAAAQKKSPSHAPAISAEPQQTTAVFGDWTLRCVRSGEGVQSKRHCEITQTLQLQGQSQAIAQLAVGRVDAGQPLRFVALLAPNVSFPSTVRVAIDDNEPQPLELTWRRCIPSTCVADAELPQAATNQMRARGEGGKLLFRDAAGRDLTVPISLRGFAPALDALGKED